jgi:two-component sensor histidine kinase
MVKYPEINLLEEIDSLSRIHSLHRDDIDVMMIEFAKRITLALGIERMSVWLFNPEGTGIVSIGEYDLATRKFTKGSLLSEEMFPSYFKAIRENEILKVENVFSHPATAEFTDNYMKQHEIISLMDIPMRIEGNLTGIMCFEKTGIKEKHFSQDEQFFALSLAMVFSSALEARQRRVLQHKLDQELREKETLIKEIHHRVKNNLSVVSSLIGLQSSKSKDEFHRNLFDECRMKINAISDIHNHIYTAERFTEINIRENLGNLLKQLEGFYQNHDARANLDIRIDDVFLHIDQAMPLSLIINEVVTNSYKHAFHDRQGGLIQIEITQVGSIIQVSISDNGSGYQEKEQNSPSLGMEIIKGLAEQLDAKFEISGEEGTTFFMEFEIRNFPKAGD